MTVRTTTIYILQLGHDKYYVGRLNAGYDINQRLALYSSGGGALWVQKYGFHSLYAKYENCDEFAEMNHTLKLMHVHGIDSVRGGPWNSERSYIHSQIGDHIRRLLESVYNLCHLCGEAGHYSYFCKKSK